MTTMIGTSHFVSLMRALAYYEPYGLDAADVKAKIEAGEIHIGKPTTKPGETLRLNDEGRYIIHDDLSPAERNTLNMADLTFAALAGAPVHSPAEPAYLHPMNLFRNADVNCASPAPNPETITGFDYTNQAWVQNGRYLRCGHPTEMECGCFGRIHQGERPTKTILDEMTARYAEENVAHPQIDEHLAGCTGCMMAHDKALNEYEEADQAELEDHAEFLRGRQLTDPSRPLDIAAWVLLGLLIFVATCEGCVIFWRMIFGAPK